MPIDLVIDEREGGSTPGSAKEGGGGGPSGSGPGGGPGGPGGGPGGLGDQHNSGSKCGNDSTDGASTPDLVSKQERTHVKKLISSLDAD